jgi:hypothetical protein
MSAQQGKRQFAVPWSHFINCICASGSERVGHGVQTGNGSREVVQVGTSGRVGSCITEGVEFVEFVDPVWVEDVFVLKGIMSGAARQAVTITVKTNPTTALVKTTVKHLTSLGFRME